MNSIVRVWRALASRIAAPLCLRALPPLCLVLLATACLTACKSRSSGAPDAGKRDSGALSLGLPPPPDVAAPPADAERTPSGLASKVLSPGTGTEHPGKNDTVRVNYSGWTTDGKMFDSTVAPLRPGRRPGPISLALSRVIPGWSEGIQLMVVGEKRRFWIPEELAYKGRPGAPQGTLVFDVELVAVTPGPKPPDDLAEAPPDAVKTKDGLASKVTQKGTGTTHPQINDVVRANFSIWQRDGRLIDATQAQPALRPVTGMSPGWTEGIQLMVTGEKRTFWVPASLSAPPRPGGPPPNDLTMVVELLEIIPGPKTPPDVKAPPKDAIFEKDGLASKVLSKGTGTVHPTRTDTVLVNYAGWTTDGKMFDSSYSRGQPASFSVAGVIAGWSEGIQLMVEGEKRRLWIPEALAYKGQPQRPQGMLVFDVELLKIGPARSFSTPGAAQLMGGHPPMPPGHP